MSNYTLPGITLTSTKNIIGPDTKLAMLLWAGSGKGKTKLASSLHKLTMKHNSKPTLHIAMESGEGGGAATLRKLDNPLYVPATYEDLKKCLATLRNDRTFGGVVLDSATEMVKQFIKPAALLYPDRDRVATRTAGVPSRSDYQVMGELTRQIFSQLLAMSSVTDPSLKKHIIVTATDRTSENAGVVTFIGPDLPGAMAATAAAMFQISATIDIKPTVIGGQRVGVRYLNTETNGPQALKDRFEVFPKSGTRLKLSDEDLDGLDLCDMWERYWIPQMPSTSTIGIPPSTSVENLVEPEGRF